MTENFIIVEKIKESDLVSILKDFATSYSEDEFASAIQLYRKREKFDSFLILFTNQPDFEKFNYIINYLRYPIGYKNISPFIRGFFMASEIKGKPEYKIGEWLMVYVSKDDKKYDNVSILNIKNENYLYNFGGKLVKQNSAEENFKLISFSKEDYFHVTDTEIFQRKINKKPNSSLIVFLRSSKVTRFIQITKDIFLLIASLAFVIGAFYMYNEDKSTAIMIIAFFGLGLILVVFKLINPKKFDKLTNRNK